jgi:hypothetical protein
VTYTYCAAVTDLADAEILAIIKHSACCEEGGEVNESALNMLYLKAGCDLEKDHPGLHASFQSSDQGGKVCAWLAWCGAVREIVWPAECPVKADGLGCLLFDEHEGSHLHYTGEQEPPAWLRHRCSDKPAA